MHNFQFNYILLIHIHGVPNLKTVRENYTGQKLLNYRKIKPWG